MLDTNIISYLIKSRDLSLVDRFEAAAEQAVVCVSSITVAELFYGVRKRQSRKLEVAVTEMLSPLEKVAFDDRAAMLYGEIRAELERTGQIIGAYDMLIAAHALSLDAILVTNNIREFERAYALQIENWSDKVLHG